MASTIHAQSMVVFLAPVVRFERIGDAASSRRPGSSPAEISASLQRAAPAYLGGTQATWIDCETAQRDDMIAVCKTFGASSTSLAHGTVSAEIRAGLKGLGEIDPGCTVLATSVAADIGPPEFYNSMTGQVRSDRSKSVFSAALIRCATGEVLWTNDVLLRAAPTIGNPNYAESLHLLFQGAKAPQ